MSAIRRPLPLALLAALALAACAREEAAPVAAPAPAAETPPRAAEPAPPVPAAPLPTNLALEQAIASPTRSPANLVRDAWRHPRETLAFFAVQPHHHVVEITPGGGWYTEILAPYLRSGGKLSAAVVDPARAGSDNAKAYYSKSNDELKAKLAATPAAYDQVTWVEFDPQAPVFGAPDSADVVLTFRNVHNWIGNGSVGAMFKGFFAVLKPGGTLGVVEHRAAADLPAEDKSGYLGQAQVIAFATAAGFQLAESSEINANPKDTRDHPNGVWTLPPNLRVPEGEDAQKYRDIGESDRMTLRFVKPIAPPAADAAPAAAPTPAPTGG